jgi:hypothetical protein
LHRGSMTGKSANAQREAGSMPPTLQVEYSPEAGWHSWGVHIVAPIAARARRSGRTAAACLRAIPRSLRMALTYSRAVLAKGAAHGTLGGCNEGEGNRDGGGR